LNRKRYALSTQQCAKQALSQGKVGEMIKKSWAASLTVCIIIFTSSFFVSLGTAIAFPSNGAISGNTYTNPTTGTISFSGYVWNVENSGSSTWSPGPNHWSSSSNNVWVDSNGWLHVQITKTGGVWYCTNLETVQALGYGTYNFVISNNAASLDKNVVLGLFAYKDDSHEVDIEFSTWGVNHGNNLWYTVQPPPYTAGYNQQSFNAKLTGSYSTHLFQWTQNSIFFESLQGQPSITNPPPSSIICKFTSPVSPSPTGVMACINLWLLNGHAPSNGKSVAIVIKSFNFTPPS
jgi:hypothetical protein